MIQSPHNTLRTDVRALAATRTLDDSIALLNGWDREYRAAVLQQFLFGCDRMRTPRRPNRFRQRDVARALRAAKATGGGHVEIDPITGKLSVIPAKPDTQASVLDEWLAKRKTDAH
jgi:hypothetical protein